MADFNMDFKDTFNKIALYVKNHSHGFVENIVLLTSIIVVNFTSYISYYDIKLLLIVDETVISKHVIEIVALYAIAYGGIRVLFFLIQNLMLLPDETYYLVEEEVRRVIKNK